MTSRTISLTIACVFFLSLVSQLSAQTMPPHVKRALGKLVGEWSCETDVDGSIYKSTHHISENGERRIPTEGTSIVDGKPVHVESLRVLTLKANYEWEVTGAHRVIAGEPAPNDASTMRGK